MTGFSKKLFLPFIYHLVLSVTLIILSIFILTSDNSSIRGTYADEIPSDDINIDIIDDKETFLNEIDEPKKDLTAAKIDKFFSLNKAPLAGYGNTFVKEAEINKIDPTIVAAIGWCESNGGKITPQFGGVESYNAWGYAVYDSNNTTKEVNGYNMGSWENGIAVLSKYITKNYDRGLVEPHEIVTRYTPASVNKANGVPENAPWTICVNKTIDKILAQEVHEYLTDSQTSNTEI